ncbi:hypothetical protein [Mucilaginibacter mallensis]|uniref:hypothetical protein n=1 Tax=Mucilaginibacter mallensis TaxID=652787 RepID=UPI0012FBFBD7|nr:hypothetical protein [Mucilaginibacter mallensis]
MAHTAAAASCYLGITTDTVFLLKESKSAHLSSISIKSIFLVVQIYIFNFTVQELFKKRRK